MLFSIVFVCFFFFSSRRRHTRSKRDWSSDVCSSDLLLIGEGWVTASPSRVRRPHTMRPTETAVRGARQKPGHGLHAGRSEERRVGKECRCGWGADHEKEKGREEVWSEGRGGTRW